MKKISLAFVSVLLFLSIAGCTTTQTVKQGRDFDTNLIKKIVLGTTSTEDVIKLFGKPDSQTISTPGEETWVYYYNQETKEEYPADIATKSSGVNKNFTIKFSKGIAMSYLLNANAPESVKFNN